jgi:hypothetical protein
LGELLYILGLRLAQIGFVRSAIEGEADLSAFKKRPTVRILAGVFLIGFSFVMCWPVIGLLGGIALHLKRPLLLAIGGPIIYFTSHGVYLAGMALSGAEYSWIFLRWLTRVGVEGLLKIGQTAEPPEA